MNKLIERLRQVLYSSDRPLEERMFFMGAFVAVFVLIANILISAVSHQGLPVIVALSGMVVLVIAAIVFVWRTNRFDIGGVAISLILGLVIFPVAYLLGGGAYSGSPSWFIICIVFLATIFRTAYFWVHVVIASAGFGIATYISYLHPELVTPLSSESMIYVDTFVAAVATAIFVSIILRYTGRIFTAENELAHKQREEIQALSDAQSRFFSSMSHEIRTPLNTIIGLNEMTLRDQSISEEVAENASNIQNASRMLLSLINDILDISKIQSGRMELTEAQYETSRMLSDVVNLLWGRAREKNLRFEVNVGESIPSMLFGDEMRIKQVIINILTNAIKYTEEGGVTLTVGGEVRGANEFMLRVDIDDTGIGIRKEAIPYLFDSFKRVDTERNRNVEGTGLGLAISKQLIDLMGGTITVDSIYTKGSHFRVEVLQKIVDTSPMQYSSLSETTAGGTYENIFEAPEAHVLIVDDNDMNRMVSRKLLRGTRVQTDVASSGAECLEKTAQQHYDVIFMDHEMPEMNGLETLERLRTQAGGLCKATPVIALTANAGSDMNAFYINHGFQAYLAKPIHGSLLEATLLQFLPPELIERTNIQTESQAVRVVASQHKRSIAITVDSPCGLPDNMLVENDISRMPFYIITEHGRFRDVEEIDSGNLFNYFEEGGHADAQAASIDEYEQFFGDALVHAEAVIHLAVSDKLSESFSAACRAADSFDNVHVVDSRHMSSGLGLMALRAVELAREGKSVEEITAELDRYADSIVATLLVPSLESPVIQSAFSAPTRFILRAFSWEPVLQVRNGGMHLVGLHGGYVSEAPEKYLKAELRKARRKADRDVLFITHAGCTLQEQSDIYQLVKQQSNFDELIMQKASATVAARVWLHSFGLTYVSRK